MTQGVFSGPARFEIIRGQTVIHGEVADPQRYAALQWSGGRGFVIVSTGGALHALAAQTMHKQLAECLAAIDKLAANIPE